MIESPHGEPDYYAVLGVAPDATQAEIERSYRELAGKRLNARWRPERAARELTLLNAAYGTLRYPDRRVEYDQRRAEAAALGDGRAASDDFEPPEAEPRQVHSRSHGRASLPGVQLGRPTGGSPVDAVIILLVVVFALFAASFLASRSLVDLSFVQNLGETLGISPRRRAAATPNAVPTTVLAEVKPSPAPATATPSEAPPGALPTEVVAQRFAGSQVLLSDPQPPRRTDLTVTLKLAREGQPVPNANVFLTAHYRTVDERQPPGNSTMKTDSGGSAVITFNIGDATPGYPVALDVTALVDGQQAVFKASFTPR
jgi:hypothetical protein